MDKLSKNILLVFGTRPELIKLAPLVKLIKVSKLNNSTLIVNTTQHNELLENQLDFWDIKPDIDINLNRKDGSLTRLLAATLNSFQDLLEEYPNLEYIIVQGDTNTALAGAQFSFLNRLKLIHIEAGLRTGNFYQR